MKRYNKLGVAAAAGVIAFLVMAAVAFGDTGSEDCIPIVTTDDTDEVGEDEHGGKWLKEQEELYDIGSKYGCDDIAERPKIEKVGGMYWRYAEYKYGGICVLTFSPQEFKDDDDMGGDYSGEIALPETLGGKTVVQIGWRLFNGKSVSSVVIPPRALVSFDDGFENQFSGCDKLVKFVVADDHPSYSVRDGFLCDKSGKKLLCCPTGLEGDVVIPDGIEEIGEYSFSECNKIASLAIPPSVRKVRSGLGFGCPKLRAVHVRDLSAWCRIDFEYVGMFRDDSRSQMSNPLCSAHNLYMDGKLVTDLEIPADVEAIGMMAFAGCTSLRSVVVPGSVTNIGEFAFGDCSVLERVEIRDGVKSISDGAFANCTALREIVIPDTVTSIGSSAFAGCSGLTSVTIPDSVTSIGEGTFYGCRGLTSVHITDLAKWCSSSFGSRFDNYNLYLGGEKITDLVIPDGVASIGEGTFYGCRGLTSVTIPDSVTSIGELAFDGCSGLTSVTIPDSVTSIGDSAFSGCGGLWSFTVGSGNANYKSVNGLLLSKDGKTLVAGINGDVTIPDSVTSIEPYAFLGRSGLTSVTIPDSVTSIGEGTFFGCGGLTSVTIPDSVTSIGDSAFSGCGGLTSVTIPDSVTSIGEWAFSGCSGLTSVTIGNGVTSIGERAFNGCSGLTSVTIPDSVTNIDSHAFDGCKNIASVDVVKVERVSFQDFCRRRKLSGAEWPLMPLLPRR